jgi:2-methylisocitrate lyase-like PEP mutase family enzyme
VVSREEAVLRIRAAADARDEGDHDIVIVARTDARQAVNLSEALWRAQAVGQALNGVRFRPCLRFLMFWFYCVP